MLKPYDAGEDARMTADLEIGATFGRLALLFGDWCYGAVRLALAIGHFAWMMRKLPLQCIMLIR
jgi:hypothetical protein